MSPSRFTICVALIAVAGAPGADPSHSGKVDQAGDPLPAGAIARIGTTRYRLGGTFNQVFLTPDGAIAIGNAAGQDVVFWEAATGKRVDSFQDPDLYEWTADLSPDGKRLALFGLDKRGRPAPDTTLRVYELATRKPLWTQTIEEPDRNQRAVRFTPDGKRLVTAAQDLRAWDAATGEELRRESLTTFTSRLAVSPDNRTIAVPDRRDLYLWDCVAGGAPRKVEVGARHSIDVVEFAGDGKTVYAGGVDAGLRGFDVATGKPSNDLKVGPIRWVARSPDGKTVATGSVSTGGRLPREFGVTLWEAATGREVRRLAAPGALADHGCWSADGRRFAAISRGRLWVWDAATGKLLGGDLHGHAGMVTALAFAPDGRLFTASDDSTVRAWDLGTGKEVLRLSMASWARGVDVSPDGSLVAGSGLRNDFRVWDAKTGKELFKLLGHGEMGGLRRVQFSADEQTMLSFGDDAYLRSWDTLTGKLKAEHRIRLRETKDDESDMGYVQTLAILQAIDLGRDGNTLAIGYGKEVRLFAADTGKERVRFDAGVPRVENLALSFDCKRLATFGWPAMGPAGGPKGATVAVWDLSKAEAVVRFQAGPRTPRSVIAFTPDGRRVVTDAAPPALQVWDATTGAAVGTIELPRRPVRVAFDGGRRMAVALDDATVLVYDLDAAMKPTDK
jgi:WD40 repeat protein